MSEQQLFLSDSRPAWQLDRATRELGLQGVRNARAILRAAAAKRQQAKTTPEAGRPIPKAA